MISIVTAYYNRKQLFYQTLKSIEKSKYKNFELIVVDDGSLPEHRLEEYLDEFQFLKIIRLEPEDKWYINPCIPFNIGIRATIGDIVILQNPECLHVHDILTYVNENIDDTKYISISTYAMDENSEIELLKNLNNNTLDVYFKKLPQKPNSTTIGWHNHSKYRPAFYHFCSAITKKNMNLLGGFDERYANGIAYDDNEFIERIKRLGLNLIIEDDFSVIHQYHPTVFYNKKNIEELHNINKQLFENVTKLEKIYEANHGKYI